MSADAAIGKPEAADMAWLQRVGFGVDSAELASYQKLGRSAFLDSQLSPRRDGALPPDIARMIGSYEAVATPLPVLAAQLRDGRQEIKTMPDGDLQITAKKAIQRHGCELAMQTTLLRLIYGADQLNEQMVWFWLNHFSVYAAKGAVHLAAADYKTSFARARWANFATCCWPRWKARPCSNSWTTPKTSRTRPTKTTPAN